MLLLKTSKDLHKWLDAQRKKNATIGFVPTMGALHEGHISLIDASKMAMNVTVCSIYVNPTQFNDPKDFEKYPVTIEKDITMLEKAGCDILFLPTSREIYPDGLKSEIFYDLGYLETILEGKYRPGHFQGVCAVVDKLLEIVNPDYLYLGQKDYQQCMVIDRLLELKGKKKEIDVVICPTLRESDGLAMSSRNVRLNKTEREKATAIYHCLNYIKKNYKKDNISEVTEKATVILIDAGFKVDYIELADAKNLSPINKWDGKEKLVALAAAYMNEVRLIDNMLLN